MAALPRDILSDLMRVLTSVRFSLDTDGSRYVEVEELSDAYLKFEGIRHRFRARTRPLDREISDAVLPELFLQIRGLIEDEQFMMIAERIPYRTAYPPREIPRSSWIHSDLIHTKRKISVAQALNLLLDTISRLPLNFETVFAEDTVETVMDNRFADEAAKRLNRIVPIEQNVAPIQFDIIEHRLIISPQVNSPLRIDEENVSSARDELKSQGDRIAQQLEQSNCDRRLLESFLDLQGKLASDTDVVRLGLTNIACEVICDKFQCELPDAVSALMKAHTLGVGMYVAQFPEWQRFTEQAASVELSSADIPAISSAVDAIVGKLEENPEIADPQVPRTLLALRSLIADPQAATKKAIFAVWRSLENLVIKVYRYAADFIEKTISKAIDFGSTVVGKGVVVALMTAALAGGLAMTPVASHLTQSAWIAKASEEVKMQIEAMGSH